MVRKEQGCLFLMGYTMFVIFRGDNQCKFAETFLYVCFVSCMQ